MNLTKEQKSVCERIINSWETGNPDGVYHNVTVYKDGPNNVAQVTYGRSQTTEYGNLRRLIKMYVDAKGMYSEVLAPYVEKIGVTPLSSDDVFKQILRDAAKNDLVMRETQDIFFEQVYFNRAMKWADNNGFTLPLSALVIYDSYIHSGSILNLLRERFPEKVPTNGGKEEKWIEQYMTTRLNWLKNHDRKEVRASAYRAEDMLREIKADNWQLSKLPIRANGMKVLPVVPPETKTTDEKVATPKTETTEIVVDIKEKTNNQSIVNQ